MCVLDFPLRYFSVNKDGKLIEVDKNKPETIVAFSDYVPGISSGNVEINWIALFTNFPDYLKFLRETLFGSIDCEWTDVNVFREIVSYSFECHMKLGLIKYGDCAKKVMNNKVYCCVELNEMFGRHYEFRITPNNYVSVNTSPYSFINRYGEWDPELVKAVKAYVKKKNQSYDVKYNLTIED